jgi:hypothetical protein
MRTGSSRFVRRGRSSLSGAGTSRSHRCRSNSGTVTPASSGVSRAPFDFVDLAHWNGTAGRRWGRHVPAETPRAGPGGVLTRSDILTEHAEEIEILWSRRRAALCSPRETLDTLAALERRLNAHIDGLALDADGAHECFERGLTGDDPDAAFMSAVTLLRQKSLSSIERVFAALAAARPAAREGIGEALRYEALSRAVEQHLEDVLVDGAGGPVAAVAVAALIAHGRRPWPADGPSLVRARAACNRPNADAASLFVLGCVGDASDVRVLADAAATPAGTEAAIRALGSLGISEAVDALVDLMKTDACSPAAGEAFWRITGLEVVPRTDGPPPDGDEHFEETRPWPDAQRTLALWERHAQAFGAGRRWRYGRPIDCRRWLEDPHQGDLLTRREEITRLRATDPGALAKLDLDAPASRQRLWAL